MINYFIGHLGHFFVVLSFVSALLSTYSFFRNSSSKEISWLKIAKIGFYIHAISVFGIVTVLYVIISNHYFEYHYAYSHSSRDLPFYYIISSFWEGQEGSFLLWAFWHVIIAFFLLKKRFFSAHAMTIYMAVQTFLVSMILGVVFINFKLGSSPFGLLRDVLSAPIFEINPDFIPEDGSGLNPLLQNYWMVIHPPTLFLGFALVLVPFSYCIGGLWGKEYSKWIKQALRWSLIAAMILGVGILMGAYWAYETLSFGGYWNWDPVENAVYIPWLVLVAAYHTMLIYQKKKTGLKTVVVLTIASFILILYSTFLTRSGILGNASVHSFTDLGLSGQLLLYLIFFLIISIVISYISWNNLSSGKDEENSPYSGEFWIFIGATVLCLMAFQVLVPTSIPVFNKIAEFLGLESNMAPPADQVEFYTKFQLWFAVAIVSLSGTAQIFWWKKVKSSTLKNTFYWPLLTSLVISATILLFGKVENPIYIIIITVSVYSITASGAIAIRLLKSNPKLSGGAITHISVALMLLGILASSGYSNIVSLNNTGMLLVKEAPEEINKENVLLWFNEPRQMAGYDLTYKGARVEAEGLRSFIDYEKLEHFKEVDYAIAKEDIIEKNSIVYKPGDTVRIKSENTYYEVEYKNKRGKTFSLFPRAQINPEMGGLLASPDIKRRTFSDLYTHISMVSDPKGEVEWDEAKEYKVKKGERFIINDYIATIENVGTVESIPSLKVLSGDIAIQAVIKVLGKEEHFIKPVYLIRDNLVGRVADESRKLGLRITLKKILPDEDSFVLDVQTTQKDFIIMKAIEKPFINILWLGTLLMVVGFAVSIKRHFST